MTRYRPRLAPLLLAVTLAGAWACSKKEAAPPPTSQRERDSALAASRLPGAQGVQGALKATDSAAARRAREDSIAAQAN